MDILSKAGYSIGWGGTYSEVRALEDSVESVGREGDRQFGIGGGHLFADFGGAFENHPVLPVLGRCFRLGPHGGSPAWGEDGEDVVDGKPVAVV